MTPADWARLYDAIVMGNMTAIDILLPKLREFLLRVARYRLQSRPEMAEEAQECVQKALIAIWKAGQKRQACKDRRAICSWCTSIVVHKVQDIFRDPWFNNEGLDEDASKPANEIDEKLKQIIRQEIIGKIFTHPRLTLREKYTLWYTYIEELDDAEIAARLFGDKDTRTETTKRTNVRLIRLRALRKLRQDGALDDDQ